MKICVLILVNQTYAVSRSTERAIGLRLTGEKASITSTNTVEKVKKNVLFEGKSLRLPWHRDLNIKTGRDFYGVKSFF